MLARNIEDVCGRDRYLDLFVRLEVRGASECMIIRIEVLVLLLCQAYLTLDCLFLEGHCGSLLHKRNVSVFDYQSTKLGILA